jgi:Ca2+-binding EF-hand superfamily protein
VLSLTMTLTRNARIDIYEDRKLLRPDEGGSMTSETLVNIYQTTQRNNPEDRNLHTLMMEAVCPLKRW